MKYGGDDLTELNISYEESDDLHTLSISDNGIGMEKEESKDIFDLFTRRKTSRGIEGTGLGLSIVKEIAERHGGRVWMEPSIKKGITFHISLGKSL